MSSSSRATARTALALLALLATSCGIPATNPYDPDAPRELQREGALVGRVVLPGFDLDARSMWVEILDEDGVRVSTAGEDGLVPTRKAGEPVPEGVATAASGAFEVVLKPGRYSLRLDPAAHGAPLFAPVELRGIEVSPGGRTRADLSPAPLPSDAFGGVVVGRVEGAPAGVPFVLHLVPEAGSGVVERQQLMSGSGPFRFDGVPPGIRYFVRAEGERYAPASTQEHLLAADQASSIVDVGTLRLVTLSALFEVDRATLDDGAAFASQAPFVPRPVVPIRLAVAQLLSAGDEARAGPIQVRGARSDVLEAILASEESDAPLPGRWLDVVEGTSSFSFDVDLAEGGDLGDGPLVILAQLRLCQDETCSVALTSGLGLLDVVLDREPPDPIDVRVGGRTDGQPLLLGCSAFGTACPPDPQAAPHAPLIEAQLIDAVGRVDGWAAALDAAEAPGTFDVVSAQGAALIRGLGPGIAAVDGTRQLSVYAKDAAGNVGLVDEREVIVDTLPPQLEPVAVHVNGVPSDLILPVPVASPFVQLTLSLSVPEPLFARAGLTAGLSLAPQLALEAEDPRVTVVLPDVDGDYEVHLDLRDEVGNAAEALVVPVRLSRTGHVAGSVALEGRSSGALDGVLVTACNRADLQALTDAAGTYRIENVPAGSCPLRFDAAAYDTVTLEMFVPAATTVAALPVSLSLTRGELRGRALLGGQSDHAGIAVSLYLDGAAAASATATTDANGDFIMSAPVGNYARLTARRPPDHGDATFVGTLPVLSSGAAVAPTLSLVQQANTVQGVVTRVSDPTQSGSVVTLIGRPGTPSAGRNPCVPSSACGLVRTVTTDGSGAFLFPGVPLGDYDVTASYPAATWGARLLPAAVREGAPTTLAFELFSTYLLIEQGIARTKTRDVNVAMGHSSALFAELALDAAFSSGVVRTACDGSCTLVYSLPSGDGLKELFVRFEDAAGDLTSPLSARITLDTAAAISSLVVTPSRAPLGEGDALRIAATTGEPGGSAIASIAGYIGAIALKDDGTQGDDVAGDGIYQRLLGITGQTDVTDALVTATFTDDLGNVSSTAQAATRVTVAVPPRILDVRVDATSETTAQVTWTTNEAATGAVRYGDAPPNAGAFPATGGYQNEVVEGAGLVFSHQVQLSGLARGVAYHLAVVATDGAGHTKTTADRTFQLRPSAPTNVGAFPGNGAVWVRWRAPPQTNIVGYRVYRGTTADPSSAVLLSSQLFDEEYLLFSDTPGPEAHRDAQLAPPSNGATASYFVVAVDESGEEGDWSAAAMATPAAPSGTTVDVCGVSSDTVLSAAGGPYRFTCTFTIPEGVKMLVGPGTDITLASGVMLDVVGTFQAVGGPAAGERVSLRGSPTWTGITLRTKSSSPFEMHYTSVEGCASNCILQRATNGSHVIVTNSSFIDPFAVYAPEQDYGASLPMKLTFRRNSVLRPKLGAISFNYSLLDVEIVGNRFESIESNRRDGIGIGVARKIRIAHNEFVLMDDAIHFGARPVVNPNLVVFNRFERNKVDVLWSSLGDRREQKPALRFNNLLSADEAAGEYACHTALASNNAADMTENHWGAATAEMVAGGTSVDISSISDYYDQGSRALVDYSGFLVDPIPNAGPMAGPSLIVVASGAEAGTFGQQNTWHGAPFTRVSDPSIELQLSSRRATEMMISERPDFSDGAWAPFSEQLVFELTDVQGYHSLFVKTRDAAALESEVTMVHVILDDGSHCGTTGQRWLVDPGGAECVP